MRGTNRSGSNVPERSSSYSSRNRSTSIVVNNFSAIAVVTALGVPVASIIAAAKMNRESNSGTARRRKARIVGADRFVEQRVGIGIHFRPDPIAPLRVHIIAVARRVNLNVGDTLSRQARHFVLHDFDDVPQQRRMIAHTLCR